MLRKIVFALIVLPLLTVPFFCSCEQKAQAAGVGVMHCHDHAKADHHSHICICARSILENITTYRLNLSLGHHGFAEILLTEPASALKTTIHLAYLGPPLDFSSQVPRYIQHHSLRI